MRRQYFENDGCLRKKAEDGMRKAGGGQQVAEAESPKLKE
jgi:hypothetical protein